MVAPKNAFFDQLMAALFEHIEADRRNAWARLGKGLQMYQERLRAARTPTRLQPIRLDLEGFQDFIERLDRY